MYVYVKKAAVDELHSTSSSCPPWCSQLAASFANIEGVPSVSDLLSVLMGQISPFHLYNAEVHE